MAVTRAQRRRAKIIGHTIDFGEGEEITFWYDRNKITDRWMKDWQTYEEQQSTPALNEMLADLIDRWDILESENGPVIPVSAETIGELFGLPDKIMLMTELYSAGVPSRAEGEVSGEPSSVSQPEMSTASTGQPQEKPQAPPNGAQPSMSPQPSAFQSTT